MIELIPLQYRLLAGVIALIAAAALGAGAAWTVRSWKADAELNQIKAQIAQEREAAATAARTTETMWQGVVNGTVKNYEVKVAAIAGNLDTALNSLRDRPGRAPGVSEASRPACAGGTGAELSGTDAEFLARQAARADQIREGLIACYSVLDGTK